MLTYVDRFLHFLEEEQERSANTTAAYRNDLTQFTRFVKEQGCAQQTSGPAQQTSVIRSWQEVDERTMQTYLHHLKQSEYATATVARKVAAVKSFFQWMEANSLLGCNPAVRLEAPKVKKVTPRPIQPAEIERLLAEPAREETPQALRDHALLETLYATGMRVTEVVALDLADVDLTLGAVRCGGTGKKGRTAVLHPSARQALERYLAEGRLQLGSSPDAHALFLNHRGQRLTRQGLWLIIKRYVKQVGIQAPVTPHTLRQSFAAHQLNAGVDLQQVKRMLGHASTQTTQAYRRAAGALAEADAQPGRAQILIDGMPYTPAK